MSDFNIESLEGGMNDFDPASELAPDECEIADDVEFFLSPCGDRRGGSSAITLSAALTAQTAITFLARHLPTIDETDAQLWAWGVTVGVSSELAYKDTTWHSVTMGDAPDLTSPSIYEMNAQVAHGKLFLAYNSGVDRLHVWDGTSLRRAGLAPPAAAPTGAETGVGGTFSGTRYYRVRYTVMSGSAVLRRSEPSNVLTVSPTGTKNGYIVTKPVSIGENETHWELEASLDNGNFYRIATTVVGTATVTDTTASTTGYNITGNTLSADIGDYTTIPSGRKLLLDEDRLIIGGNFEDSAKASQIVWTTVFGDVTGVGNDERIPTSTSNTLNLDNYEGGPLTDLGAVAGIIFAFKFSHIYTLVRTGQLTRSYQPITKSKKRGALPNSVVEGVDESGRPALYFLDPKVGPYRIGSGGMLWAGRYIYNTWQRLNVNAAVVTRAVFYADKNQIHWWIAVDGSNIPTLRIVLQTDNSVTRDGGVERGWSRASVPSPGALAVIMFSENIEAGIARSKKLVPMVAIGNTVQIMDTGSTDNGTAFAPHIVTAPRTLKRGDQSGLTQKFGIRAGSLSAIAEASTAVKLKFIRDYGVETSLGVDVSTAPKVSESLVIRQIDNLKMAECLAVQLDITDGTGNDGTWGITQVALLETDQESM